MLVQATGLIIALRPEAYPPLMRALTLLTNITQGWKTVDTVECTSLISVFGAYLSEAP
jgi:hypothetical protein